MKLALALFLVQVTFVSHDKVPKNGTLVSAPNLTVLMVTRYSKGEVEVHDKETDTFHVLDGSATLITDSTMIGGRVTGPRQQRRKNLTGRHSYTPNKGA